MSGSRVDDLDAMTGIVPEPGRKPPAATPSGPTSGTATGAPRWSVIVIARNEEATIKACLDSVLRAFDGRPYEVIFVDSASVDRTVEIACRFPVRVVRLHDTAPRRPAVGRHVGFGLTRGRWLLFLDGDCVLEPSWVDAGQAALEADPRLAGVSGASEAVLTRGGDPPLIEDQYPGTSYDESEYLGGSAVYRREALEACGGFNPFFRAQEEAELGARLRKGGYRLRRLRSRMTQHFRKNPKQTVPELFRRVRAGYPIGVGQFVRHALADRLPVTKPFGTVYRPLAFLGLLGLGLAAAVACVAIGSLIPVLMWLALMAIVFGRLAWRARTLGKPAYYFLEWTLTGPLVLWGLLKRPRSAAEFPRTYYN